MPQTQNNSKLEQYNLQMLQKFSKHPSKAEVQAELNLLDKLFETPSKIFETVKEKTKQSTDAVMNNVEKVPGLLATVKEKLYGMVFKMKDAVMKIVDIAWRKCNELSPRNKYVIGGLFGAFILFSIYKLIKWLKNKKEEETVVEVNENFILYNHKLQEGINFLKTLTQTIREEEDPVRSSDIIDRALPLADEVSEFVINSEEESKNTKSFITKYGYAILASAASMACLLVYWYNYKKTNTANPN